MPVVHVSVTSPLPPQEALQRLTDFRPARAEAWAGVDDNLIVHDRGDSWVEVTESNKLGWERERYTWDVVPGWQARDHVQHNSRSRNLMIDLRIVRSGARRWPTTSADQYRQ